MKSNVVTFFLSALFTTLSLSSIAGEEYTEQKHLSLENIQELSLKMHHADIVVSEGKSDAVEIKLTQELLRGEAEECLHHIKQSKKRGVLNVSTEKIKSNNFNTHCKVLRKIEILIAETPLRRLNFSHSHGSLSAESFSADQLNLKIGHSKFNLKKLNSSQAQVEINHTDSKIEDVNSEQILAKGSHGELSINTLNADNASFKWSHGDVNIENSIARHLDIKQKHGDIRISRYEGLKLALRNSHGLLAVDHAQSNNVDLKNSHGSIYFSGNSNDITFMNSHGHSELKQNNPDFTKIIGKATHGAIQLNTPKGSICELQGEKPSKVLSNLFKEANACKKTTISGLVNIDTTHGKFKLASL